MRIARKVIVLSAVLTLTGLVCAQRSSPQPPPRDIPARLAFQFRGRTVDAKSIYEPDEPISFVLQLIPGTTRTGTTPAANSVHLKTLFQPGDITITVDDAPRRIYSTLPATAPHVIISFDPVQTALDRYRKDHPQAIILPTPEKAWITTTTDVPEIPIKALVAESAAPNAKQVELDCGLQAIPKGYSTPGTYALQISLTPAAATVTPASPNAASLTGTSLFEIASAETLRPWESTMTTSRADARIILEFQARLALHTQALIPTEPLRLVTLLNDEAGLHYQAAYANDAGQTAHLRLFGTGGTPATISLNHAPARWPATLPSHP